MSGGCHGCAPPSSNRFLAQIQGLAPPVWEILDPPLGLALLPDWSFSILRALYVYIRTTWSVSHQVACYLHVSVLTGNQQRRRLKQ